jgi:hypothetical protein
MVIFNQQNLYNLTGNGMKDITSRVRSCLVETFKIDGKMRTRTFKQEKYVVL